MTDWVEAGGTAAALDRLAEETKQYDPIRDVPLFTAKGAVVPLGVAYAILEKRPNLVSVQRDFWDFNGKVFEKVRIPAIDDEIIRILGDKSKRGPIFDVRHILDARVSQSDTFFDLKDDMLIHVRNGVYDVQAQELKPHAPHYRSRNLLPFSYDPEAECPRFRLALNEWLPGDVGAQELLVEWIGHCLIRDCSLEKMLFLLGEGANGKGRYIRVIENLLGDSNIANAPLQALRSDRTFPTTGLIGKLVNICPEAEMSFELDEGWIKSICSGDTLEVERKGGQPLKMRPYARFIIQSNNPPTIRDKSNATWRRMLVVRFERAFAEHEQDRFLDAKLAEELPGIFNLALEGLSHLTARGRFEMTAKMIADRESYRKDCNPLQAWREEKLHLLDGFHAGETPRVSGAEAYASYRDWNKCNGHSPYSRAKFTKEMKRLGFPIVVYRDFTKTMRGYEGVFLTEE